MTNILRIKSRLIIIIMRVNDTADPLFIAVGGSQ